jgi:Predicted pyridoxal phosphate-dependent enzyme apparently involved in regulation of cell wall biogenesis
VTEPRRAIPNAVPHLAGNEWKYLKECLDTNWVSSVGPFVSRFELEVSAYVGVDHAVATVNGTAALPTSRCSRRVSGRTTRCWCPRSPSSPPPMP